MSLPADERQDVAKRPSEAVVLSAGGPSAAPPDQFTVRARRPGPITTLPGLCLRGAIQRKHRQVGRTDLQLQ
eukprot:13733494-Alexandrium_andersonii.AAC.1